ncbi:hypothetical protein ABZY36_03405 [Streptomyces sp. NPDC006627]|uniref:hypothetical protein n=1 Tax=Streptomyces sp. NPDC006627 TaxID=3154679 RepID=UPI0033A81BF9
MDGGSGLTDLLRDRLLTMVNDRSAIAVLPHVDRVLGGLVVTGAQASARCRDIRNSYPDLVVAVDLESHTRATASVATPFGITTRTGWEWLDAFGLQEVLEGQLRNRASFAVTPTCFIRHDEAEGDAVLRSVVARANALERDDMVVLLPCSYKWLQPKSLPTLATWIGACRHPTAVILQSDGDPLKSPGVAEGLRRLCRTCPRLTVWRTDLAAFDAMAHGALGGAIGTTAALRHGMDPARRGGGGSHKAFPVALVRRILRYVRTSTLLDWFAAMDPWVCECGVCRGSPLTRFDDTSRSVLAAMGHNVRCLYTLHRELADTLSGHDRLEWWRQQLDDALAFHQQIARQAQMEIDFPRVLQAWRRASPASLPQLWGPGRSEPH